jgi:hypothetical protein
MHRISLGPRGRAIVLALAVTLGVTGAAASSLSQAHAERFSRKVTQILEHAEVEATSPRRTVVTEVELNAFLAADAREYLPTSVTRPVVAMLGPARVSGSAIVDLDVVRGNSGGGWLDPLSYLSGRLPVVATGTIDSRSGVARLLLERTEIGGVAVPPSLLQEIVSFYTRSDEYPRGVRLDEPFDLPARIERIEIVRGQAVVVQ